MTPQTSEPVAVLGSGTWGLSLACLLHNKGVQVIAWDAFPDYIEELRKESKHPKLPYLKIPQELKLTSSMDDVAECRTFVLTVASHAMRTVCEQFRALNLELRDRTIVICTKGLEEQSLKPMAEVVLETLGANLEDRVVVLSGPSHAEEVSRNFPTTVVAASADHSTAITVQDLFTTPTFRVYTHDDVLGVELGGSLKNIIAIAAGICDGLGFGDNSRAALITRGLVEMTRLGMAMGAHEDTFSGLAGMGDLIVTAGSHHSRNRNFGEKIASGLSMEQAQHEIGMVVEGIRTCACAVQLAEKYNVDMPITSEVNAMLFKGKDPRKAVRDLMEREPKPESERLRQNAG